MNTTTNSNPIWRIRTRWSREANFFVQSASEEAAREFVRQQNLEGKLDISDAEPGKITEYFSPLKAYPTGKNKQNPMPPGSTVFVIEDEAPSKRQQINEVRVKLREHHSQRASHPARSL
jgi:hypothetical protein